MMTGIAWAKNPMLPRLKERDHSGRSTILTFILDCNVTGMTTFIKAKLKKSDGQKNVDKFRV